MAKPVRAAVLGDPVSHSLSPRMHTHWFSVLNIAGDYVAIQCPGQAEYLTKTIQELRAQGYTGCNLTVPLKEIVLAPETARLLAVHEDESASRAGAANTLVFSGTHTLACNTDIQGVQYTLQQLQNTRQKSFRTILILGAGGAARGAIAALSGQDVRIQIANRTQARSDALARRANAETVPWDATAIAAAMATADCIIQTTSMELLHPDQMPIIQPEISLQDTCCFDMVYRKGHPESLWSAWASAHGSITTDGLPMLVAQGAYAFQMWTGVLPDIDATIDWMRHND